MIHTTRFTGVIFTACLVLPSCGGDSRSAAAKQSTVATPGTSELDATTVAATPEMLLQTFGEPTERYSSETEIPRPPLVTQMFTYQAEGVRVVYIADAKIGEPPPYKGWKLMGFTDPILNERIDGSTAMKRLRVRVK